jgi:hypothetical protein
MRRGGNPCWKLGIKSPKVMRLLTKTRRLKRRERQGFGEIAIWFNHQSFAGPGHNSQNINIRGDVQRSNLARWATGDMCPLCVPHHLGSHRVRHSNSSKMIIKSFQPTAQSAPAQHHRYRRASTAASFGLFHHNTPEVRSRRVPFLRTEGILVLKVPVGSDTYVRTQLVNKVEELRTRMQVLGGFQDTQAALLILRVCMGVCRVNFLLRALAQPLVKDAADVFDDLMRETFASISCAVLPDVVWAAAQLPISVPDYPGLGLTSAKNTMSAAHLATLTAAKSVLSKLLPASLLQASVSSPHVQSRLMTSALVDTRLYPLLANFAARFVTSRSPWLACAQEDGGGVQTTPPCGGAVSRTGTTFDSRKGVVDSDSV